MTTDNLMQKPIWRLNLKSIVRGRKRGGVHAMVIIAATEAEARELGAQCTVDHHDNEQFIKGYIDPDQTDCVIIGYSAPGADSTVVVVDYDYDYDEVKYDWVTVKEGAN